MSDATQLFRTHHSPAHPACPPLHTKVTVLHADGCLDASRPEGASGTEQSIFGHLVLTATATTDPRVYYVDCLHFEDHCQLYTVTAPITAQPDPPQSAPAAATINTTSLPPAADHPVSFWFHGFRV